MQNNNLEKLLGRPVEVLPLPSTLHYPRGMLSLEALKGGAGAAICIYLLSSVGPGPVLGTILGGVGLLFGMYMVQQVMRIYLQVVVDDIGIREHLGRDGKRIRWNELEQLTLNYYPQSRGAKKGILVLSLKGGGSSLKHDSTLDHFPTLLARAASAARERNITLKETTEDNFTELGL